MLRVPLAALWLLAAVVAGAAPLSPEQSDFFEKQIRPVLSERCYECHSAEKKQKGGLALDTRAATLKGGDTGPSLVPGDPEKSLLVEAVRWGNRDLQMPPKKRLTESEIKALEAWVKMGAPDPREAAPVAKAARTIDIEAGRKFWSFTPLARVTPPAGPQAAIDGFIQTKLRAQGLRPAPAADLRTVLRRATFDLTGLPPTPEEMEAFLADDKPDAFDRVIERLLASPQYGERWGRHWLDVARYADSNGLDENVAYGHAWRYRDYVVRAFNDDRPFDQFLIEQVAGDLLPRSEEALTATGFLALGAKVLAEPDVRKLEMDIIDEQIDTVGKAFLGMTLGCVRCHDHKFDPITQEDYYALAAIFRSTRSLAPDNKGTIKYWYDHSLATPEQLEAKKQYAAAVTAKRVDIGAVSTKARGEIAAVVQARAVDYLVAASLLPANAQPADADPVSKAAQLDANIVLSCRRYLDLHKDALFFTAWRELAAKQDPEGIRKEYAPLFAEALATKKGEVHTLLTDPKGPFALPARNADVLDAGTLAKIAAMSEAVAEFEAKAPDLPGVMCVADQEIVKELPVHLRGSYLTLGKPVDRGFPEVMRTSFAAPILPAKHSGRLELARWMASGDHPLTARVMVNRVWRWHFGQGIATSTDNFGLLGDRPSHPELLDWLARTFVESGWSIKDLHRLIMKSAVYRQASRIDFSAADQADPRLVDPENRLLWRANIQRLEAEEIRDAMLATCGWLSLELGGKTIPLRNREFVFNHTSKDATTYESARRALYQPIIRNHLYDMLEQFDYPDPTMPTGSRHSTVIAPQALIMMNAPVVMESSRRLAERLASLPNDEARVRRVYALLYGRPPTEIETKDSLAFVRDAGEPDHAWTLLCQALYAANEFIYLR